MITTQQPILQTATYQEVVRGLLRLHRYTVDKQDETSDYRALCEALDGVWGQLSAVERERVGGLSEDLYTVSTLLPEILEPMTPQHQGEFNAVYEARQRGDWDSALAMLRKLKKVVPPALLAYVRGTVWEGLDDKQVAVVFYERACHLDPNNQALQAAYLNVLKWTDGKRAMEIAETVLAENEKFTP